MKLKTFIDRQVKAHPEPTRKDTPKGEPVGLSREKFEAALYVGLTNYKAPKITKIVDISSPGLLRKWKTEPQFKEAVRECIQDFIDTIFQLSGSDTLKLTGEQDIYSEGLKKKAESAIFNRFKKTENMIVADVVVAEKTASDISELNRLVKMSRFYLSQPDQWPFYSDLHYQWVDGVSRLSVKQDQTQKEKYTLSTTFDLMKEL